MSLYKKETPANLSRSISCILAQTIKPDEIVIVKDGELTQELESVLSDYSRRHEGLFKIIGYSENRGLWYALRFGMDRCKNELIVRMDTDDYCVPERVEKQIKALQQDSSLDCIGANVVEFEGEPDNAVSLVILPETHEEIVRFGKRRCPFRHPALLYRKSAVERAGGYREMPMFEDYDLYMRMAASGSRFKNIQEFLVRMGTSTDFYQRRGNYDYFKKMIQFRRECLKRGDVTAFEFITATVPHALVCLMPNSLRTAIYKHLLRNKPISSN